MPLQNGKFVIGETFIGAWNVHSIWSRINSFRYNKINDSNVLDVLLKYKIFCLIETHHVATESDMLHIPNYVLICAGKRTQLKNVLSPQVA